MPRTTAATASGSRSMRASVVTSAAKVKRPAPGGPPPRRALYPASLETPAASCARRSRRAPRRPISARPLRRARARASRRERPLPRPDRARAPPRPAPESTSSSRGRGRRSSSQQRLDILPEDLLFLVRRQALQALHPGHRRGMPGHERPVTAEHDTIDADLVEQEAQRLLAADHGVVVEPALVAARRPGDGTPRLRRAPPAPRAPAHRAAGGGPRAGGWQPE